MPRLRLRVDEFNAETHVALRALHDELERPVMVDHRRLHVAVVYPDTMADNEVRDAVEAALARLAKRGIVGVSLA